MAFYLTFADTAAQNLVPFEHVKKKSKKKKLRCTESEKLPELESQGQDHRLTF